MFAKAKYYTNIDNFRQFMVEQIEIIQIRSIHV